MIWNISLNGWRTDGTCAETIVTVLSLFMILPQSNETVIVKESCGSMVSGSGIWSPDRRHSFNRRAVYVHPSLAQCN
jgi:hypothetical protein